MACSCGHDPCPWVSFVPVDCGLVRLAQLRLCLAGDWESLFHRCGSGTAVSLSCALRICPSLPLACPYVSGYCLVYTPSLLGLSRHMQSASLPLCLYAHLERCPWILVPDSSSRIFGSSCSNFSAKILSSIIFPWSLGCSPCKV